MLKVNFQEFSREMEQHGTELREALDSILKSSSFILGPQVRQFEQKFAKYLGVKHVIGVANGLEALQISLMALEIGVGDEVITTPLSAVATTLAILAVGAKPVFVDVTPNGQINVDQIETVITKKTKVVIPVHLYGHAAPLAPLQRICRQHHLVLLEDAAQAHGTVYKKKKVGSFGQLSCFSFYPTKNLGTLGDGGAVATNSTRLATICRELRDYGQKQKYIHTRYGLNSRLDELHAALLMVKLKYLDQDNRKRRLYAQRYRQLLADIPQLQVVEQPSDSIGNYHLFVIRVKQRDKLQQFLKQHHIISLVHYPVCIPDQPFLKSEYSRVQIPEARRMVKEILSLPCHPYLTEQELTHVIRTIHSFYHQ